MSKALRRMTQAERQRAITRRLKEKKGGLGYWAAVDAFARRKKKEGAE